MPSIADLKARMALLNNRGAKKPQDLFKPKDEHEVRLMEYPEHDDPFVQLSFHYEVGETVLCPLVNFGEDCSICTFADVLKSWKDQNGNDKVEMDRKNDWELFKKIQAKARVFVPMVERGKESEGARWWGLNPNQVTALLESCCDGDRLEMLGIDKSDEKKALQVLVGAEKAFDLKVVFRKAGEKGNTKSFNVTDVTLKVKATPLLADKAARDKLLASVKNISDVYPKISSAEVHRIMEKFIGVNRAEAKPEGGTEYGAKPKVPKAKNSGESAEGVGGKSIDQAFGDMLKDEAKA